MAAFLHVAPTGMRFNASELGAWHAAAWLEGEYVNIRGSRASRPDAYAPDSYAASQQFGETIRASGGDGILYGSVRLCVGVNVVAYRPTKIEDVVQADHFEISVQAGRRRIEVRKLTSSTRI